LLILVILAYSCRSFLLTQAGQFLNVSEPPRAADYVMVLGGDSQTRPFLAAALYKAGMAQHVLVPQMRPDPNAGERVFPEEEVIKRVLSARQVPDEAITFLDWKVASTKDEAEALARFLQAHSGSSITVVTSNYHTRRARWIFRKALGDQVNHLHFVGSPTEGFDASNWWRSEAGFVAYTNEFIKLAAYWVAY
jgi:uncharacterized SAM-binding protein YcdF (DUF218 family)